MMHRLVTVSYTHLDVYKRQLMWDLMKQVAGEMGVRTDVPFNQLTPQEMCIRDRSRIA